MKPPIEDDWVKFGTEISRSLHLAVKVAATYRRMSLKAATQEAFEAWLLTASPAADRETETPRPVQFSRGERNARELLHQIFVRGSPRDIEWIMGNLRNFNEAIQSRPEAEKRGKSG